MLFIITFLSVLLALTTYTTFRFDRIRFETELDLMKECNKVLQDLNEGKEPEKEKVVSLDASRVIAQNLWSFVLIINVIISLIVSTLVQLVAFVV